MNGIARGVQQARGALNRSASQFMSDKCSLLWETNTDDGRGGWANDLATVASNVPCSYKARAPVNRTLAGQVLTDLNHEIKLPSNANTQTLSPNYKILVQAQGDVPALMFESPVVLNRSLAPFVTVAAALMENANIPVGSFPPLPVGTGVFQEEISIPSVVPATYTLTFVPFTGSLAVFKNGSKQALDSYSLVGQVITLPVGLIEGDLLSFAYLAQA